MYHITSSASTAKAIFNTSAVKVLQVRRFVATPSLRKLNRLSQHQTIGWLPSVGSSSGLLGAARPTSGSAFRRSCAAFASGANHSSINMPMPTVSTEWLQQNLSNVKVVDASWYMPNVDRDPKAEFLEKRIPGAVFFDLDGVVDAGSSLPHMLPPAPAFAAAAQALHITNQTPVVVYDCSGLFSAARVWWMFKVFGHTEVSTLEGGLPAWVKEARPLETDPPVIPPTAGGEAARSVQAGEVGGQCQYQAALDTAQVKDMDQMLEKVSGSGSGSQVVDARSRGRFAGTAPEPRAGVRGGHMPHSYNVPFDEVLQPGGYLKAEEDLKEVFTSAGLNLDGGAAMNPITASCGTGVTACVLALALQKLGVDNVSVYDGSWSEWGAVDHTPIEKDE